MNAYAKLIRPRLREMGIPAVIPEEAPYLSQDPIFNYAAFYSPPGKALDARRVASDAMKDKERGFWPGRFASLGNAWIYIGVASTEDARQLILPQLKASGFTCKEGESHLGKTGIYVEASGSREAEKLITQDMKLRNRPFDPASNAVRQE